LRAILYLEDLGEVISQTSNKPFAQENRNPNIASPSSRPAGD